jgi:hypothetical protein
MYNIYKILSCSIPRILPLHYILIKTEDVLQIFHPFQYVKELFRNLLQKSIPQYIRYSE